MDDIIRTMSISGSGMRVQGQRLRVIAQNIANANSDNYHPIQVTFEDSLRAAAAGGPDDIAGVTPQTVLAPWQPGDEMRLDLEIATASQTALRFSALIGVLDRQMQIARTVVSGGR